MLTGKEALLPAMIEAYVMEKGTNEFYKEAAMKASSPKAKEAFGALAEWEHEHMLYIQFLYQAIQGEVETVSFENFEATVRATIVEGGMPIEEVRQRLEMPKYHDDLGAINVALEIEGRACNLYRKISSEALDTNAREFMKEMVDLEMKHIEYLQGLKKAIIA